MMSLLGADLGPANNYFQLHKTFQIDGFLTLLIMGVGYMIVPRFRNVQLSSNWLAYLSFGLVVVSLAATTLSVFINDYLFSVLSVSLRLVGISIFACIMIWTIRIHPRLLRRADYFIVFSVATLVTVNLIEIVDQALGEFGNPLSEVQLFLLFPLLM